MATETKPAGDAQTSEYSMVTPQRVPRLNPEAAYAPTCMIWCMTIGIGLLVLIMVVWGISNIGFILKGIFG